MEVTGHLVEIFQAKAENVVKTNAHWYFASQLNNYAQLQEFEVLDSLCYFCDFVENTSCATETATLVELTQKYLDVLSSKHGEGEFMRHTIAYGLGEFGYYIPPAQFAPFLPKAIELIKPVAYADDGFDEENLEKTENSMGALMKLAYKHLDGTNVTKADMVHVLSHMPFTEDEPESKTTHRIFLEEVRNQNQHLMSPEVKPAVQQAVMAIKEHLDNEGDNPEVQILTIESKGLLEQLNI